MYSSRTEKNPMMQHTLLKARVLLKYNRVYCNIPYQPPSQHVSVVMLCWEEEGPQLQWCTSVYIGTMSWELKMGASCCGTHRGVFFILFFFIFIVTSYSYYYHYISCFLCQSWWGKCTVHYGLPGWGPNFPHKPQTTTTQQAAKTTTQQQNAQTETHEPFPTAGGRRLPPPTAPARTPRWNVTWQQRH